MQLKHLSAAFVLLLSVTTSAEAGGPKRWVPPPAPQMVEGDRIAPIAEVFNSSNYILHFPKPEQTDWRQTRYEVQIRRSDEQPFAATVLTRPRPFAGDEELVFLTIPKDSASKFTIEVIDKDSYPYKRVWSGSLDKIEVMRD